MPKGTPKVPRVKKESLAEAEVKAFEVLRSEPEAPKPEKKEVVPDRACLSCAHSYELHYGTEEKWCNTMKCKCLAWK